LAVKPEKGRYFLTHHENLLDKGKEPKLKSAFQLIVVPTEWLSTTVNKILPKILARPTEDGSRRGYA